MRWFIILACVSTSLFAVPIARAAEGSLQTQYLNIYLKINDAEHLEKSGDYRGALADFKDCYEKLNSIHEQDPNWEAALVLHRMDDCKTKILELEPKAAAQPATTPAPAAQTPPANTAPPVAPAVTNNSPPAATPSPDSDEVSGLKLQLQAVKDELNITKEKLQDSEAQLAAYRMQLQAVNKQLADLKAQPSSDDRIAKLSTDNKDLTTKLAAAQREIDDFKSNPKSKLALAQAQLKNLQDQYEASQAANKALQDTTTTLKQQLDQAQKDLTDANQKLAAATSGTPEYETLKRENEVMRDILTRELREQAHRDMAKRLMEEEFDNLKLKSKVLQEQLDIVSTPMTPPTTDEERALLASLKVPGPEVVNQQGNQFTAPASGTPPTDANTNTSQTVAMAPANDSSTNAAAGADSSTNQPPVTVVMNNPAATDTTGSSASSTPADNSTTNAALATTTPPATNPDVAATTNTPTTPPAAPDTTTNMASATPPSTPSTPATTTPDANSNAPIPPIGTAPVTNDASSTPPPPPSGPTKSDIPPAQTTIIDTTVKQSAPDNSQPDPTKYSTKARLPEDMRDTAQQAVDLFKNGKYDESAAKYQAIIDKYPESLYAWSNLGVVRFQQQKYDEALKALQQAVKLSPTDAFSYSNLGIVYYQLGQYENAIDALNSAKALDPNDAKTHNYLGCACSQKGWQEVAENEFRKASEIDPNFGDAHFNLALVLATAKPPQLEMARREYNRALELGIAKDARLEKLLNGGMNTP